MICLKGDILFYKLSGNKENELNWNTQLVLLSFLNIFSIVSAIKELIVNKPEKGENINLLLVNAVQGIKCKKLAVSTWNEKYGSHFNYFYFFPIKFLLKKIDCLISSKFLYLIKILL